MATINPRYDKNGNTISYQIRVFRGRDSSGKRLKDYMMTWRPDPGMTKRQIEREVQRQATLFEENCRLGNVSTEKITFERYAAYVVDLKGRTGLKAKTLVPSNTARRATPPKVPKHELDTFEADEVKALLDALMTEPLKWQVITMLLIGTGARRGEIMSLQWKNDDFDNSRLYLCENRVYTRTTGAISTTLKTDESRYVTISPSITALLRRWKEEQSAFFDHLGITPSGYVATADSGKPMHPDSPTDWLANFAKRHDLPPIHPHKFRHTQASLLISEGVDILTVSKRLGHAKVSTTLDIYSHVLAKSDRQASDALDALIFQKKEG